MPVAALAGAVVEPLARGAIELAQTPVLGWERVKSYTKGRTRVQNVQERTSFTLRAWEVALLGGVGLVAFYAFRSELRGGGGGIIGGDSCAGCIGLKVGMGVPPWLAALQCVASGACP